MLKNFNFEEKKYHVKGFVGILADGGFGKAGFALFRRGRVVIGGVDMNYKPNEIFGQPQSPIAHKLFGEFDLEDFPVNQAKDGFVWDNGLESCFISYLKDNIQDYINIAKLTKKERAKEEEFSKESSDIIQKAVNSFVENISQQNDSSKKSSNNTQKTNELSEEELFKQFLQDENSKPTIVTDSERSYVIKINSIKSKEFLVKWAIGNNDYWINVDTDFENLKSTNFNYYFNNLYKIKKIIKSL